MVGFAGNGDPREVFVGRRTPFDALERIEDGDALQRERKVMTDKTPRARTVQEMLFAASLVPCPKCGAPTGNLGLQGDADNSVLFGPCPSCGTPRSFQFATEGIPRKGAHERLELGDARPSAIIGPGQFVAELTRLAPSLHDDPRSLSPAEWREHYERAGRAYTCAVELAKFLPAGTGDVPGLGAPHDRAWVERERERAITRLDRIVADSPRLWARQGGGKLHFTEELRGLLNQSGRRLRPSLTDLKAYLAPRAKTAPPAGADVVVELMTPGVAGVRLWEDPRGVLAEMRFDDAPAEEIKDALLGYTLSVEVRQDADVVKAVTVDFTRP